MTTNDITRRQQVEIDALNGQLIAKDEEIARLTAVIESSAEPDPLHAVTDWAEARAVERPDLAKLKRFWPSSEGGTELASTELVRDYFLASDVEALFAASLKAPTDVAKEQPEQHKAIDYKLLLAKYIEHVGAEEGVTFISRLAQNDEGMFKGQSDKVKFTRGEVEALQECDDFFKGARPGESIVSTHSELKPCPFCGGTPTLEDHRLMWSVDCKCGACIIGNRAPEPEETAIQPTGYWEKLERSAIELWNRRAAIPQVPVAHGATVPVQTGTASAEAQRKSGSPSLAQEIAAVLGVQTETPLSCPICCARKGQLHTPECDDTGIA